MISYQKPNILSQEDQMEDPSFADRIESIEKDSIE